MQEKDQSARDSADCSCPVAIETVVNEPSGYRQGRRSGREGGRECTRRWESDSMIVALVAFNVKATNMETFSHRSLVMLMADEVMDDLKSDP
ncbi:hypothetical protein Mapa_013234 [Marchantia paleacea]|nr:hypothetical protein Mapa_013234 [Marchantia paleacea]